MEYQIGHMHLQQTYKQYRRTYQEESEGILDYLVAHILKSEEPICQPGKMGVRYC